MLKYFLMSVKWAFFLKVALIFIHYIFLLHLLLDSIPFLGHTNITENL